MHAFSTHTHTYIRTQYTTLSSDTQSATSAWHTHTHTHTQELRPELLRDLANNAALNSKAFLIQHGKDMPLEFVGNRTECALLALALKWGVDYKQASAVARLLGKAHPLSPPTHSALLLGRALCACVYMH
jgi:hypothetical protein